MHELILCHLQNVLTILCMNTLTKLNKLDKVLKVAYESSNCAEMFVHHYNCLTKDKTHV